MRDLMQVGIEREDSGGAGRARLTELRQETDEVAGAFVRYLTRYPPKTRRTRHGLLGPVAEVVKLAGRPLMTVGQATGRAVRMHEMAQEGRRLDSQAMALLEEATRSFFDLVERSPVHLRKSLRDRILDHVYFLARKEETRFWQDYRGWLKQKYGDIGALNDAWTVVFASWDRVRNNGSEASKLDFDEFRRARKEKGETIVSPDADEADEAETE